MKKSALLPLAIRYRLKALHYIAPFYFSFASIVLIVVAAIHIWPQPYDGLEYSLITYEVEKVDGPAAKAGFRVGDELLKLDGIPIRESHPLYKDKRAGDRALFTLMREGETLKLKLTLEEPSPRILALRMEPIAISVLFWLFSTILLALRPGSDEIRLFFLFCQLGSIILSSGIASTFLFDWASRIFKLSLCIISPLSIHFHLSFPRFKSFPRRLLILSLLYGIGIALCSPFVIFGTRFLTSQLHPTFRILERLYFSLSILVSVASLAHTYIKTPLERRRIRLIFLGTTFAFSPLVILSILPEVVIGSPLVPYELSFPFLILIPLSYSYAVYKRRLWRVDIILNRSVVYFAIGIIWAGIYTSLVMVLDYLLPSAVIGRPLLGALATLIMASFFASLKKRIQALVDWAFYGGWYDYQTVISQASRGMSRAIDASQLVEILVNQTSATMRIKCAALLLPNEEGYFTVRGSRGFGEEITSAKVRVEGELAQFLEKKPTPIESEELRRMARASSEEEALLRNEEIRLWVPLLSGGKLRGLLLLGAKAFDEPLTFQDFRILGTLSEQAGIACENVRLVEDLRRKLEDITAMKEEIKEAHRLLAMGREEERKRLAWEIHDIPLQKSIVILYGSQRCQRMAGSSLLKKLKELEGKVLSLSHELRRICQGLRSPTLDTLGLDSAIRSYTE